MNRVVAPLIMLVVLLVLIASGTFYTVDETEQVVVTQFGEAARAPEEQRVAAEVKSDATVRPTVKDVAPEERLGRDTLTALMVKQARQNMSYLGIELIDVRIKGINYVREVEQRVYERMISERRRIAARFRSEGDGASAKIRGEQEREIDRIRYEAERKEQETIGKADAEAAHIYAESYSQDPKLHAFYQ